MLSLSLSTHLDAPNLLNVTLPILRIKHAGTLRVGLFGSFIDVGLASMRPVVKSLKIA